jgi:hypothetical protein
MKRKGKGFSEERVFEIAQGALVRWWWVGKKLKHGK